MSEQEALKAVAKELGDTEQLRVGLALDLTEELIRSHIEEEFGPKDWKKVGEELFNEQRAPEINAIERNLLNRYLRR